LLGWFWFYELELRFFYGYKNLGSLVCCDPCKINFFKIYSLKHKAVVHYLTFQSI